MTSERDTERLLDEWLSDGPTVASDRVIDNVADRIGRQSQRPTWLISWRESPVNSYLKPILAVAAVIVVVVAGIAILARPTSPGIGGPATASPSPSPSPSPQPTPSPTAPPLVQGVLEARDYVVRASEGEPLAFTITAPAGWTGLGGWFIAGPHDASAPDGIGIAFARDPQVVDNPCDASNGNPSPAPGEPAAASVDDLVAALSANEHVSGVTDVVLGGYAGKRLDLQLPSNLGCSNHYVLAEPQGLYAQGPANRWRVWLLDVAGETAVVILRTTPPRPPRIRPPLKRPSTRSESRPS